MTPMQKKVEKLEQEMKYVKKVADTTRVINEKIELMFNWLVLNLTEEQKADLANFVNIQD